MSLSYENMAKKHKLSARQKKRLRAANKQLQHFYLYTDGSCDNLSANREGGYAYILLNESKNIVKQFSQGLTGVSSNQMELMAIIEGCKAVPTNGASVTVISDSRYAINILSGKWHAKANLELIKKHSANKGRLKIDYQWVKGHNGDKFNEMVDYKANQETLKLKGTTADEESLRPKKKTRMKKMDDIPFIPDYRLYATSVFVRGFSWAAYILTDKSGKVVDKASNGVDNTYSGILECILNGCRAIPDHASIQIMSDNEYGVKILSGRWRPKKFLNLIQAQINNEKRFGHVVYTLIKSSQNTIKEAISMATRAATCSVLKNVKVSCDEEPEPDVVYNYASSTPVYDVSFSANFDTKDIHKIYCFYAMTNSNTEELTSGSFVKELEVDKIDDAVIQSLALVILEKVFESIPDDAEIHIYSEACYKFLSEFFGNEESEACLLNPYIAMQLKYTQSGAIRSVDVINSHKGRLNHGIEREKKK